MHFGKFGINTVNSSNLFISRTTKVCTDFPHTLHIFFGSHRMKLNTYSQGKQIDRRPKPICGVQINTPFRTT